MFGHLVHQRPSKFFLVFGGNKCYKVGLEFKKQNLLKSKNTELYNRIILPKSKAISYSKWMTILDIAASFASFYLRQKRACLANKFLAMKVARFKTTKVGMLFHIFSLRIAKMKKGNIDVKIKSNLNCVPKLKGYRDKPQNSV